MTPTIREDCPCPNTACSRHTFCDECEESRVATGKLPFCRRPPRSLLGRILKMLNIHR
ncbi:MAG: hypothetical protein LUQ71_07155 [Methanoregula sp.]|nr:hypothetical protein [Methanoregula sp.]